MQTTPTIVDYIEDLNRRLTRVEDASRTLWLAGFLQTIILALVLAWGLK